MAVIKSIEPKRGGRAASHGERPVTRVDISFKLTREEAALLPPRSSMHAVFGRAMKYDSWIDRRGGELAVSYRIGDRPFGCTDVTAIAQKALSHVHDVLRRRRGGSGGN